MNTEIIGLEAQLLETCALYKSIHQILGAQRRDVIALHAQPCEASVGCQHLAEGRCCCIIQLVVVCSTQVSGAVGDSISSAAYLLRPPHTNQLIQTTKQQAFQL